MISDRMTKFSITPIAALMAKTFQLRSEGKDVITLHNGEPDFATPDYIKLAGIKAIIDNRSKYTLAPGTVELRQAIADKLNRDNNLPYNPEQICVCSGAKPALYNAMMAIANPGDEIIAPSPCWDSYTAIIQLTGAKPVFVPTNKDNSLNLDNIENAITDKTKALLICTPNNPTGAVYSEESLRKLAEIVCRHDLYIIVDEIYEKIIYDGEKHFSIGSISKEVFDRTITVNGFSKTYSMTGWRMGYAAAGDEVSKAIAMMQTLTSSSTNAIAQYACQQALLGSQESTDKMVAEYDKRRRYLMERIADIDGMTCAVPKGAFYAYPDVTAYYGASYKGKKIQSSADWTQFILDAALVVLVPGEAFNNPGGNVRIAYCYSMAEIEKSMDRIKKAITLLD